LNIAINYCARKKECGIFACPFYPAWKGESIVNTGGNKQHNSLYAENLHSAGAADDKRNPTSTVERIGTNRLIITITVTAAAKTLLKLSSRY
jgi:hypothetical protein